MKINTWYKNITGGSVNLNGEIITPNACIIVIAEFKCKLGKEHGVYIQSQDQNYGVYLNEGDIPISGRVVRAEQIDDKRVFEELEPLKE